MKKFLSVSLAVIIILLLTVACKRKEKQPVPQVPKQGPIIESIEKIPGHENSGSTKKSGFQVVVPPEVKEGWSAVRLIVNDRELNKQKEFIMGIGEESKISGTNLSIKVGHFLPDFKMSEQVITSASNNPNNPSAGVMIYEDGKKIYPVSGEWGWLYAKLPTIHAFQHQRYEVFLKEGIRK